MIKFFPSFSFLLLQMIDDSDFMDQNNHYYFFACWKEGIEKTFDRYDRNNKLNRESVLSMLEKAEKEGRVCWNSDDKESQLLFLKKLGFQDRQVTIEDYPEHFENRNELGVMLNRNLPSMRNLITQHHSNIQFMWS